MVVMPINTGECMTSTGDVGWLTLFNKVTLDVWLVRFQILVTRPVTSLGHYVDEESS